MADTIKLPGIDKPLPKQWVYIGGAAVLGFVAWAYVSRYRQLAAGEGDTVYGEGYDEFGNLLGADPGITTGAPGLFDQTPEKGFGFATNAEWTQFVLDEMARDGINRDQAGIAIGKYLTDQALTAEEVSWIRYAIAVGGYPPVGSFQIRQVSTPPTVTLIAPKNLKATPGVNQAILSWDPVPGATSYQEMLAGLAWVDIGNVTSDVVDFPPQPRATDWRLSVRAVANGQTGPASSVTARVNPAAGAGTIAAPTGLRVVSRNRDNSRIRVRWNPVPGAQKYYVSRGDGGHGVMVTATEHVFSGRGLIHVRAAKGRRPNEILSATASLTI